MILRHPKSLMNLSQPIFLYFRNALGNHLDLPEKHGLRKEKKKISMKEYAPYIDLQADLPTILEAYHFLIKKFVLNPRERKRRIGNVQLYFI